MDPATLFTTDNRQEEFDLVNEDDVVIGTTLRSEVHANPALIHRSATVMVFDGTGRLLLQKRSKTKDTYPGYWAPSCSGHVGRGEDYLAAAIREMGEELGVSARPDSLQFLFKQLMRLPQESEYTTVFEYTIDPKTQSGISIQSQEIEEIRFLFPRDIIHKYHHCMTPDLKFIFSRLFPELWI